MSEHFPELCAVARTKGLEVGLAVSLKTYGDDGREHREITSVRLTPRDKPKAQPLYIRGTSLATIEAAAADLLRRLR